jgi:oxaloacetate decarboxylase gamma subunit
MLIDGLKLMIIGMGYVFLFLSLMVIVITITAKIVAPFAGLLESPAAPAKPRKKADAKKKEASNNSLIAAAISAVHRYRDENES